MTQGLKQFVPCPACRGLRFAVVYEEATSLAHVLCENCNRELMAVAMTLPEEPLNTRVAPI